MLVIRHTPHFRIEVPSIVTIGTFDGVHLGHQKILKRLSALKQHLGYNTAVFTFEPHPRSILFPEQKDLKLLTTTEEKLEQLEKHGVDVTVVYPFTRAFAQLDSESYIKQMLVAQLHVKHLVIGYDHKFGHNRSGDIHTLRQFAASLGFEVEEISVQDIDNIAVSSSKIRKALEEGKVELACEFSGSPFELTATVVKGKQLGRTLGYPTANLKLPQAEKIIPAHGVYFVEVQHAGQTYHGMMNIGTNPTTDTDNLAKLEVNIFGFDAEIYGQELKVKFIKRLRDEKKFNSLAELQKALDDDREACLQLMETV